MKNVSNIEINKTVEIYFNVQSKLGVRGYWENGEAYQDGSDSILIETIKAFKIKEVFENDFFIYKPKHNLLHEHRTRCLL